MKKVSTNTITKTKYQQQQNNEKQDVSQIKIITRKKRIKTTAKTKQSQAFFLTIETIGLAVVSGFLLKLEPLQKLALSEPELLLILPGFINLIIGKFAGLRISERLRFRPLIEEE